MFSARIGVENEVVGYIMKEDALNIYHGICSVINLKLKSTKMLQNGLRRVGQAGNFLNVFEICRTIQT